MRGVVSSKEQEITNLRELGKSTSFMSEQYYVSGYLHHVSYSPVVAELQRLQDKLIHSEQELQSARCVCS